MNLTYYFFKLIIIIFFVIPIVTITVFTLFLLWLTDLLIVFGVAGLHVRSGVEDLRMTAETTPVAPPGGEADYAKSYDSEYARMEAWLDEHPDFVQDYFLRYKLQESILYILCVLTFNTKL